MTTVKTAISLPSDLLEDVDRRAAQWGESRSGVIRAAVSCYLDALKERELRERIREEYGARAEADEQEFQRRIEAAAMETILRETEWYRDRHGRAMFTGSTMAFPVVRRLVFCGRAL